MNPAEPHADTPPGPQRAGPTAPARRSFAISVGAAVALNLLGIGAFLATAAHRPAAAGSLRPAAWITAVDIVRPAALPEPAATPVARAARPSEAAKPAIEPVAPRPPAIAPAIAPVAPPAAAPTGDPTRFYRSGEVDRPAEPDSDWNLDTAALDSNGIQTLVFDIFVDRDGAVVGCKILAPATLADATRDALEERLRQTVLSPAIRGGSAVASVRRIEVSVLPPAQ